MMRKHIWIVLATFLVNATLCWPQSEPDTGGLATGVYGSGGTKDGGGGVYIGIYDAGPFHRVINPGFFIDLGMVGPTRKSPADGVFSFNCQSSYLLHKGADRLFKPGVFFLTGGYSGFFNNGNGANYGGGFIWRFVHPHHENSGVRLEYREAFVPGWGQQPWFRISFEHLEDED